MLIFCINNYFLINEAQPIRMTIIINISKTIAKQKIKKNCQIVIRWKFFKFQMNKLEEKIPLYLLDQFNLKDAFEKTSMEIFHSNQIRLAQILEEINQLYSGNRGREMMVKIYSVFGELKVIFSRLGLSDLFQQIRLIVNAISKLVLLFEPKQSGQITKKNQERVSKIEKESKLQLKQVAKETKKIKSQENMNENDVKGRRRHFGGIFLYNQSYQKTIEPIGSRAKREQVKLKEVDQLFDKDEQLQKQQMWFYIERKKDLSVIKVKDHSKNYKEIQNQFKVVEERLIQSLEGLHIELNHQSIKQSQYLSKEQINTQLFTFNSTMRSQLRGLKNQYDNVHQQLIQKNKQLTNRLNQQLSKKDKLIHSQVQTSQSIGSYKKTKKICEEYEARITKYEQRILEISKKLALAKQEQQKMLQQLLQQQEEIVTNKQTIAQNSKSIEELEHECTKYKQFLSQISFNQNYATLFANLGSGKIHIPEDEDAEGVKRKKILMNKFSSKDRSMKIASRKQLVSQKKILEDKMFYGDDGTIQNDKSTPNIITNLNKIPSIRNNFYLQAQKSSNDNKTDDVKFNELKRISSKLKRESAKKLEQRQISSLSMSKQKKSSFSNIDNKDPENVQKQRFNQLISPNNSEHQKERKQSQTLHAQSRGSKSNETNSGSKFGSSQRNSKSHTSFLRPSGIAKGDLQSNFKIHSDAKKAKDSFIVKKGNLKKVGIQKSESSILLWNQSSIMKQQGDSSEAGIGKQTKQLYQKRKIKQISLNSLTKQHNASNKLMKDEQNQKEELNKLRDTKSNFCQMKKNMVSEQIKQNEGQNKTSKNNSKLQNMIEMTESKRKQLTQISQKILKQGKITVRLMKQISKDYPEIWAELKQPQRRDQILKEFNKLHQRKCKQRNCRHLQSFVQFCYKFQQSYYKRPAMRLHVQDFSHF